MVPPPNKRSKTSESSGETVVMQNRLLVPIAAKKNTELLELQPMTEEDLKLLQKKGKQSCCCVSLSLQRRASLTDLLPTYYDTLLLPNQTRSCTTPFQKFARLHSLSRRLTTRRSRSQRVKCLARREFHSKDIRTFCWTSWSVATSWRG